MRTALEVRQSFHTTHISVRHFLDGTVDVGSEVRWRWSFLGVDMGNVPAPLRHVLPWLPPIWSEVTPVQNADFELAEDDVDSGVIPLFTCEEGVWTASIPNGWTATLDGQPVTDEVHVTGTLILSKGDLSFRAQEVSAPSAAMRSSVEPDPPFLASFAMMASTGAMIALIGFFSPAPPQTTLVDIPDRVIELRMSVPPEPEKPTVASSERSTEAPRADPSPAKAVSKRTRDRQVAETAGMFSLGDSLGGFDTAGIDTELSNAISGLTASRAGRGPALGGIGGRGQTLGGGGDGENLGSFGPVGGGDRLGYSGGTGGKPTGILTTKTPPLIIGNLDPALIDAVIKSNLSQIRYCYRRELQRDPDLGGKTVFKFVIASDGTVSSAKLKSSTLGHAGVERCIVRRLQRMTFPAPSGGGIAIVSYPFLFSPG